MTVYPFLRSLLEDKKGGRIFTCFGAWHLFCIALTFAVTAAVIFALRKKDRAAKDRAAKAFLCAAFGLYVLDFFLMPLAYGEIDIEKLPFHGCTASCVACFLSVRLPFLKKLRVHFALLGFITNLVYLIYPAGVMWHAVHPLCYRAAQTILFHSVMTCGCFLTLLYAENRLRFRTLYKDAAVLVGMILWALLGNAAYNGDRLYNWFFVVEDPFGIFDPKTAPFIMPFLVFALFFAVETLIVGIFALAERAVRAKNEKTVRRG